MLYICAHLTKNFAHFQLSATNRKCIYFLQKEKILEFIYYVLKISNPVFLCDEQKREREKQQLYLNSKSLCILLFYKHFSFIFSFVCFIFIFFCVRPLCCAVCCCSSAIMDNNNYQCIWIGFARRYLLLSTLCISVCAHFISENNANSRK